MSLTAKIYKKSPILEWFNGRHNPGVDKIIAAANKHLQTANPLAFGETRLSTKHGGLIKAAAVYALLKHIGYVNNDKNWIHNTPASQYLLKTRGKSDSFGAWINARSCDLAEISLQCLFAGALDISHRLGRDHDFIKNLVQHVGNNDGNISVIHTNKKWIKPWQSEIEDVLSITHYIARCHKWESHCLPVVNPTFDLSNQIGGAEADLIIGDSIVSVVTSREFTLTNLYELLAYILLDTNDVYSIKKIVWVYPLWQASVVLECSKLFSDIQATRKQFKAMIEENYPIDEFNSVSDGTDTLKYSSH